MSMSFTALFLGIVAASPVFDGGFIFSPNEKHNHGSSIVETPQGDLLAAWFHGSGERTADDVVIQGARKRKDEEAWSEPFLMADTPDLPDCNPVLFMDPRGVLWLFWVAIQNNQWGGALLKYRTASAYDAPGPPQWDWQDVIHTRPKNLDTLFPALVDNARETLGPLLAAVPKLAEDIEDARAASQDKLHSRLGWMTRIHPIMVSEKRMLLGLYSDVFNCSLAAHTEDWGATWACGEPIMDPEARYLGNIQPSFAQRRSGAIVAFMRDNGIPKYVRTAISEDLGETWSRLATLEIRNPGSSVDCIVLESGRWLMICNDTLDGRHIISAYLSDDEGTAWKLSRRIEDFAKGEGSFSYPSVIQAKDGLIHCTYSYSGADITGSTIKHVRFNEAWVLGE